VKKQACVARRCVSMLRRDLTPSPSLGRGDEMGASPSGVLDLWGSTSWNEDVGDDFSSKMVVIGDDVEQGVEGLSYADMLRESSRLLQGGGLDVPDAGESKHLTAPAELDAARSMRDKVPSSLSNIADIVPMVESFAFTLPSLAAISMIDESALREDDAYFLVDVTTPSSSTKQDREMPAIAGSFVPSRNMVCDSGPDESNNVCDDFLDEDYCGWLAEGI